VRGARPNLSFAGWVIRRIYTPSSALGLPQQ
jgi:hypothetical protein